MKAELGVQMVENALMVLEKNTLVYVKRDGLESYVRIILMNVRRIHVRMMATAWIWLETFNVSALSHGQEDNVRSVLNNVKTAHV